MKVSELIEALKAMPQDAEVGHVWDGAYRTDICHVWVARNGKVMTADDDMVVYYTDDRPEGAPTQDEADSWYPGRPAKLNSKKVVWGEECYSRYQGYDGTSV